MGRPFAIIGFTMFAALFFLCTLGCTAAYVLLALSFLALDVLLLIKRFRKCKALIVFAATCLFCSVLFLSYTSLYLTPIKEYFNKNLLIRGTVTDYADEKYERYYYDIRVESIGAKAVKHPFKIVTSFGEDYELEPGDAVQVKGKTYLPGNGKKFSMLNFYSKGVYFSLSADEESLHIQKGAGTKSISFTFSAFRKALIDSLYRNLPADNAALAGAVLTGEKSGFDTDVLARLNTVGISHIICVSGLHLSIIGFAVIKLCEKLSFNRKLRYGIAAGVIVFFMALCGFTASVVRAGIMFLIYIFAQALIAEPDSKTSLGIAAIIILMNPYHACNIGFVFSFCATLSIITAGKSVIEWSSERLQISQKKRPVRVLFSLAEILMISACVNAFCLPFSILFFGKVNLISLLANVLILPIASALLISCALSALLGLISVSIVGVILYPVCFTASVLCAYILKTVELLSRISFSYVTATGAFVWLTTACMLMLAVFLYCSKKKAVKVIVALLFILALPCSIASRSYYERSKCDIRVHNAGYGMLVSVRCGDELILIDTGADSYAYSSVEQLIFESEHKRVDYLVLLSKQRAESGNVQRLLHHHTVGSVIYDSSNPIEGLLAGAKALQTENYNFTTDAGLEVRYYHSKYSAVHLSFCGSSVLIVNSSKLLPQMLPKDFQNYTYLIYKGNFDENIVNSSLNGIIEINRNESEILPEYASRYYSTSQGKDIYIRITSSKTIIGSQNEWQ